MKKFILLCATILLFCVPGMAKPPELPAPFLNRGDIHFFPQPSDGFTFRFMNGSTVLATRGSGLVNFKCSTGMTCTWASSTFTMTSTGGGGTPGGSNTQVQYNNSGAFGGITNLTANATGLLKIEPAVDDSIPLGETSTKRFTTSTFSTSLKAPFFSNANASASAAGIFRCQNNTACLGARNFLDGANFSIKLDASNLWDFGATGITNVTTLTTTGAVQIGSGTTGDVALGSATLTTATAPSAPGVGFVRAYSLTGDIFSVREGAGAGTPVIIGTRANFPNAAPVRGSIFFGNSTPAWAALAIGAANRGLFSDGTDVSFTGLSLASATSGGVFCFTGATTPASSGALTANLPVIGGGAGVCPTVGTRSGNTTAYVTTTGTQTSGDCVKIDASGNHVANGSACGSGGGGSSAFVSNTTEVNAATSTTSDQNLQALTLSAAYLNTQDAPFIIHTSGKIVTISGTPTIAYKIKLCTVSGCGSGTVVTLATITTAALVTATSNQYSIDIYCGTKTTGASGNLICHGPGAVDLTAASVAAAVYTDANTATSSNIDLTAALFIQATAAFSGASASNSITGQLTFIGPQGSPTATSLPFSGLTGATNSSAAMLVGTGASLGVSGSGTIAATSAPTWIGGFAGGFNPSSGTTYYMGMRDIGPTATTDDNRTVLIVPKTGTLTYLSVSGRVQGTLDSAANNVTCRATKNLSTDSGSTLTVTFNVANIAVGSTTDTFAVTQNDLLSVKCVTPTFSTSPTTVQLTWSALIN